MRIERRGDEFCVMIPRETLEALHLAEGDAVEVRPINPAGDDAERRTLSVKEALEAFRRTEHLHANTYRELAMSYPHSEVIMGTRLSQ